MKSEVIAVASDWRNATWQGPSRIVCLTEETTEWLYMLGQDWRIVGISGYTVRPPRARLQKPKVSAFLSAKIDKILALEPDLVLGFSDMQAEIADKLIRAGVPVVVFNQRSVAEIFDVLQQVAALVGCAEQGAAKLAELRAGLLQIEANAAKLPRRPRVFFEEWDEPQISAIRWVSELVGIAGGDDCFAHLGLQSLGKNRIMHDPQAVVHAAPDIIIGSWCGKKFRPEKVTARPGYESIPAVQRGELHEVKSSLILQPGPAALTEGVAQLHRIVLDWAAKQSVKGKNYAF